MKPSVGRIVIFKQSNNEPPVNGTMEHPAIITRVQSDVCVNLKVMFDAGETANVTSVPHASQVGPESFSWDWPQRVEG